MAALKNKIYKPLYLLMGEEPYYIDLLAGYMTDSILPEAERSFNQTVVYGKDVSGKNIVDLARRYPMMSAQQVVVVKEAQNLKDKDLEDIEVYLRAPLASTILIVCYKGKSVDKRKAFYKQAQKVGDILETAQPYDSELSGWVKDFLKEKGCTIEPAAATILAEALGADLGKIVNELSKLMVLLPQGTRSITAADIEKNIGISKEYNNFELNAALSAGNVLKANRIVQHFEKNPKDNPMVLTISSLYSHFLKLFTYHMLRAKYKGAAIPDMEIRGTMRTEPYFVREYEAAARRYNPTKTSEIISLLREFDMRSKGWNNASTEDGDLLRELVYKIMH
jgi:DNA polymerase-3 subunit delta